MPQGNQFGVLKGVFIPSILTILGVILFLRLGWVVGEAGLTTAMIIIAISSLVTFITGLSISATATNTDVGPGGSYFLISRCFGTEPGAAVGIPLYLAQALGISFYSVGFAESLQLFFPDIPIVTVAMATLAVLTVVTLVSSEIVLRTQTLIFLSILVAIGAFWLGSPLEASQTQPFERSATFWQIFAVFFPAVTGIEAGVSMSGDLKDPRRALPLGTLAAVIVGCAVYMFSAYMLDRLVPTDQLVGKPLIMTEIAAFPILVFLGLWGATLSSTMGALLGAPRTLQALAKDKILPRFLAKGDPVTNEPKIATAVSVVVAACGILIGDLNAIASILSMFFLTSYGALNLVSGIESIVDNPSWRPSFRVHWSFSIAGALLCFSIMFMIDPGSSIIALVAIGVVYFVVRRRRINPSYSDIRSGVVMHLVRRLVYGLNRVPQDARNWRPHFLVFAGAPKTRLHLIQLADSIGHKKGFLTVASVLTDNSVKIDKLEDFERTNQDFLLKQGVSAIAKAVKAGSLESSMDGFLNYFGVGRIRPNTFIFGDSRRDPESQKELVQKVFHSGRNVLVVKEDEGTNSVLRGQKIDLWWDVDSSKNGLSLTLAYMLSVSERWRGASVTIKCIVESEEARDGVGRNLKDFSSASRIRADVETFVCLAGEQRELIARKSKEADIVFISLDGESSDYTEFLKLGDKLRALILVLEAEEIDFSGIFTS